MKKLRPKEKGYRGDRLWHKRTLMSKFTLKPPSRRAPLGLHSIEFHKSIVHAQSVFVSHFVWDVKFAAGTITIDPSTS